MHHGKLYRQGRRGGGPESAAGQLWDGPGLENRFVCIDVIVDIAELQAPNHAEGFHKRAVDRRKARANGLTPTRPNSLAFPTCHQNQAGPAASSSSMHAMIVRAGMEWTSTRSASTTLQVATMTSYPRDIPLARLPHHPS